MRLAKKNRWLIIPANLLLAALYFAVDCILTEDGDDYVVKDPNWFIEKAKPYFITECYRNTAIVPMAGEEGMWGYGEQQGTYTLVLNRGYPHSTVTTAHGYGEILSLEFSEKPKIGRFGLHEVPMSIGFFSYASRTFWGIGEKGVSGYLEIISIDVNNIVIEYDIIVNAFDYEGSFLPEYRNKNVKFGGKSIFPYHERPDPNACASIGRLFDTQDESKSNKNTNYDEQ